MSNVIAWLAAIVQEKCWHTHLPIQSRSVDSSCSPLTSNCSSSPTKVTRPVISGEELETILAKNIDTSMWDIERHHSLHTQRSSGSSQYNHQIGSILK